MSQVATVILKQCETYRSSTITYPIVLYQGVERAVIEDIRGTLRPITTTITPPLHYLHHHNTEKMLR